MNVASMEAARDWMGLMWMVMLFMVFAMLLWRAITWRRRGACSRARRSPERTLADRYARGEISAEDYRESLGVLAGRGA